MDRREPVQALLWVVLLATQFTLAQKSSAPAKSKSPPPKAQQSTVNRSWRRNFERQARPL